MLTRFAFSRAYGQLAPIATAPLGTDREQMLVMRMAISRGDSAQARKASQAMLSATALYSPGTVGIDQFHQHALLLLAMGDTAAAIAQLDAGLDALPRVRAILLKVLPQAGALVPAMMLRAELAWRANDRPAFDRWARPAALLWSDADPELRGPVDVLRSRLPARR